PIRKIGVKVRPLKTHEPKIAAIPALQPGPIRTLYSIQGSDAKRLPRAAGAHLRVERTKARHHLRDAGRGGWIRRSRNQPGRRTCGDETRDPPPPNAQLDRGGREPREAGLRPPVQAHGIHPPCRGQRSRGSKATISHYG